VTGRAFEPGAGDCPCGLLPLGAVLTPLGGCVFVCVLPDGAGVGGVVCGVPGCCCANAGFAAPKRQSKSANAKDMIIRLKLRRFITILISNLRFHISNLKSMKHMQARLLTAS
jgi:hypothetical protein